MQNNQQLEDNNNRNILKYSLIVLMAVSLSAITYTITPLNWVLKEVTRTALGLQHQWMFYSHSIFSWFTSGMFIFTIILGFIAPFLLGIIVILQFFKRECLPNDDPNLVKVLNYWLNLVLTAFVFMLVVCSLETLKFV